MSLVVFLLVFHSFTSTSAFDITPQISEVIRRTVANDPNGDPFYLINLDTVANQLSRWRALLPNIRPHYAVKANPNPALLELLYGLGASFDCASKVGNLDQLILC